MYSVSRRKACRKHGLVYLVCFHVAYTSFVNFPMPIFILLSQTIFRALNEIDLSIHAEDLIENVNTACSPSSYTIERKRARVGTLQISPQVESQ